MDRTLSSSYSQSQNDVSGSDVCLPVSRANNLQREIWSFAAKVEMERLRISTVTF